LIIAKYKIKVEDFLIEKTALYKAVVVEKNFTSLE